VAAVVDGVGRLRRAAWPSASASTFALFWDTAVAREELKRQAADPSKLTGFEAEITLREFDAGRLNTVWQPKGRSR